MTPDTLLRECRLALEDWVHCYAGEMCDEKYVKETHARISDSGGTLAYIADIILKIDAHLAAPQGVCPHIATSAEGTSYCRLAESASAQDERGRVIEECARVCRATGDTFGKGGYSTAAYACEQAIRALGKQAGLGGPYAGNHSVGVFKDGKLIAYAPSAPKQAVPLRVRPTFLQGIEPTVQRDEEGRPIIPDTVRVPREPTIRERQFLEGKTGVAWLEGWQAMLHSAKQRGEG